MKENKDKVNIKFLYESSEHVIKQGILNAIEKHRKVMDLAPLAKLLKKELDEQFPKGWVVVAGMKIVASFSHIENTLFEFEANGISFIIFKTMTRDQ